MRRTIDDDEYWRQLRSYERSAWRFEQQPAYWVGYEREQFDRFLDGNPESPEVNSDLVDWFAQVRAQVDAGRPIGRVRIIEEPPTDYQRWVQWVDRWNREAGETIQYLPRAAARAAGLPVDGGPDWWLFDDQRLMLMHFDDEYRLVHVELLDGGPEVEQACRWRDLAINAAARHSMAGKPCA